MNADLNIQRITGGLARKRFIELPFALYRDDPHWVPPLNRDQEKILCGGTAFFANAEMNLFLALRGNEVVGRIAAIHNRAHLAAHGDGVGFFGFFECAPGDAQAAGGLLKAAEDFLRSRGLATVRGPVNPSMNSACGLLVEGFDSPPMILMPHNPPYYGPMLESLGLAKCKDLYAYAISSDIVGAGTPALDRLLRLTEAVRRRCPEVTLRTLNMRDYEREVLRFIGIFEEARRNNWGYVPLTREEILQSAREMKRIIDPELIILAEAGGQPAGALLALPNVNRAMAVLKGRLGPVGLLRFMCRMRRIDDMRVIGVAALEKYRRKGITGLLFGQVILNGLKRGIRLAEASWVLEDNFNSNQTIQGAFNPRRYKTYRIYEKSLLVT